MAEQRGVYGKYKIEKADGSPVDPEAVYFVLRVDTDAAARTALRAYCRAIKDTNRQLARELCELICEHADVARCGCRSVAECSHESPESYDNAILMRELGMLTDREGEVNDPALKRGAFD
jgi:hypothetical protein